MNRTTRWAHEPRAEPKSDEMPQLYAEVFGSIAGQRVLDDLCRQANIPSIDLDNPDPSKALMLAARHNLVGHIFRRIAAANKQ